MESLSRRGAWGAAQGKKNRDLVRQYLRMKPDAFNTEISAALGIGEHSVGKHRRVIEAENNDQRRSGNG